MNKIEPVIQYFGGTVNFAKALGVTSAAVCQWRECLPKGRAYEIEVLTNGKFKAKDLTYKNRGRHG